MELAATARYDQAFPHVSHVPRERNTWADELSKGIVSGFAEARRWTPSLGPDFFFVLDDLSAFTQAMA